MKININIFYIDLILKKCYETKKPFALLLPKATQQGLGRFKLFEEFGCDIISFDSRVDFLTKETNYQKTQKGVAFTSDYFSKGILQSYNSKNSIIKYLSLHK